MIRFLIAIFAAAALLCGSLLAQSPESTGSGNLSPQQPPSTQPSPSQTNPIQANAPAAAAPGKTIKIAPGSVIPVQLTKSIDAKKAKKGDEVVVKVTQDLQSNGSVVVPKDTKIVGHVTEAEPHGKEQKESQLAIAFDHAILKNGEQMQMPMSIQAIIAPPNRNAANTEPPSNPGQATGSTQTSPSGTYGSMGRGTPPPANNPQSSGSAPSEPQAGAPAQPPITGNTQGVVGIRNLKLSAASDPTQGSVVTSEKNNVKLDDGTFMLLKVNQ